jgi:hypothetical protein
VIILILSPTTYMLNINHFNKLPIPYPIARNNAAMMASTITYRPLLVLLRVYIELPYQLFALTNLTLLSIGS